RLLLLFPCFGLSAAMYCCCSSSSLKMSQMVCDKSACEVDLKCHICKCRRKKGWFVIVIFICQPEDSCAKNGLNCHLEKKIEKKGERELVVLTIDKHQPLSSLPLRLIFCATKAVF